MSKKKKDKAHKQRNLVAHEMFQNCKGHWHEHKKDFKRHDKHKNNWKKDLPPIIALLLVLS